MPTAIEQVQAWFDNLNQFEKDMPFVQVGTTMLTPREILSEVKAGTPVGSDAYQQLGFPPESKRNLTVSPDLIVSRLEKRYQQGRMPTIHIWIAGRQMDFTPAQQIAEARAWGLGQPTIAGKTIIDAEAELMQWQLKGPSGPHGRR